MLLDYNCVYMFLLSSEKELELPVAASGALDPEKMVSEVSIQFSNYLF